MRIVIALNAGQCPDCDARGFDHKPRISISRNIFCKACDQGFDVAPDPPGVFFVQRIGRRARANRGYVGSPASACRFCSGVMPAAPIAASIAGMPITIENLPGQAIR